MLEKRKNLKKIELCARNITPKFIKKIYYQAKGTSIHRSGWSDNMIQPDDCFLVSYPRSGNTWLRYLMTNLRFPNAQWDIISLSWAFPEIEGIVDPRYSPKPRWIKSHSPYNSKYPRVIYLVRDGRDVAVSLYHWSGRNKIESFSSFLQKRFVIHSTWHHHVIGWLTKIKSKKNMLLVRYEDLVKNPYKELERISNFVQIKITSVIIRNAIDRSVYKKQQEDFKRFKPFQKKQVGVKGAPGSWKRYFDNETSEIFWKHAREAMRLAGYSNE